MRWQPSEKEIAQTHIGQWMKELHLNDYKDFHKWSVENYSEFWKKSIAATNIPFKTNYKEIVDTTKGVEHPEWLPGAQLNIADSCFTAEPDKAAIVYKKLNSEEIHELTYKKLNAQTNQVANALTSMGFKKGDAIAIDMPMTVESVIIYLGIVKMGGAAVSIADSFAPSEIATRLKLSKTKLVFTQDVTLRGNKNLPMYEKVTAAEAAKIIILPATDKLQVELRKEDLSWEDFLADASESFESVPCSPEDVSNILFSSGTTGDPKAIPWTHTTPIKAAVDAYFHHDVQGHDVVAWPTNLGWMMGPWLIYASLTNQATMALCYDPPLGISFGQFVEKAKVTVLGLVPSIVKVWRETECMKDVNWKQIKAFSSTGECSNPSDYSFLMSLADNRPIIEYCGGTEIGGGYMTGTLVQTAEPSTFTTPALGLDFVILDEDNKETSEGEVYLIPPSIGLSNQLLNRDHYECYYEGTPQHNGKVLRRHGDRIIKLENGNFRAQGRSDDTMNLGGIKTSSADIERVLNSVNGVSETAAIAVPPKGGGPDRLVVYVVAQENLSTDLIKTEFQKAIKKDLNPLFKLHDICLIDKLPRTASNKVMRRVLRDQYQD